MRRPLAVFGCVFLVCLLAASGQRTASLLPIAALAAAAFCAALLWRRAALEKAWRAPRLPYLPLVLLAISLALFYRAGYDAAVAGPVRALAGESYEAEVLVQAVEHEGGEVSGATVSVRALNGQTVRPFKLWLWYPGEVGVGDVATGTLRLVAPNRSLQGYYNAKGIFLTASTTGLTVTGRQVGPLQAMRLAQYALSETIREKLPARLGGVAAAMAVGDRRHVPDEAVWAYRAAGISHLQVVSGLHLAILCSLAGAVGGVFVARRRHRALVCLAFVLAMMALTGFTPSIVRSGVVFLVVYSAALLWRRPDTYTSLGLAAVLLCIQNPYAAADMGLLLSCAATLGLLVGGELVLRLRRWWRERDAKPPAWYLRALRWLFCLALRTLCITLATLPVLLLFDAGVSLLTVPVNLVAVPMMPLVLVTAWLMAIPAAWPVLGLLARVAALVNGGLLAFLERLTGWCASLPGVYVPLSGWYGLVAVLVVYGLCWLCFKSRCPAYAVFCALVLVPAIVLLHGWLSAGLATVVVAGSANPSLVVVGPQGTAVVLYRGSRTLSAVERTLAQYGVEECALLVDMRAAAQGTEYEALAPAQVVRLANLTSQAVLEPGDGTKIWLKKQGGGAVACVELEGFRIALATGSVDLTAYAPVDILVAGNGEVRGEYDTLLATAEPPEWADPAGSTYLARSGTLVWLRPGESVLLREVEFGTDG